MAVLFRVTELIVERRFCGPPRSANGGWASGSLAVAGGLLDPFARPEDWPAVQVDLVQPPPLASTMQVTRERDDSGEDVTRARFGGALIATARAWAGPLREVEPVDARAAAAASARFPGHERHLFPGCFVCGTARSAGEGMRIFPGPLPDDERFAAVWMPSAADVGADPVASVWAALDCPGGWVSGLETRTMVLGRMRARLEALPIAGDEHVVVAQRMGHEGRRFHAATTLFDPDGRVVATSEQTWVEVSAEAFGALDPAS